MAHDRAYARIAVWLLLIVCLAFLFLVLSLLAFVTPIDTGEDIADLTLSGILRGAV
ncbi:hypothetical protein WDZ92_19685 [Nostoc sp. NIES-2111]